MMQQWSTDDQMPNRLGISQMQQSQDQSHMRGLPFYNGASDRTESLQHFAIPQQMHHDMFDCPEEANRRTLTQDQFDAIARNGGMVNGTGNFEDFHTGFYGDQDVMNQVFPGYDLKQQDVFAFPHPVGAPLSSNDSTVPSTISDASMSAFPSSNIMQTHANISAASSDWGESRSSSLASTQVEALQHQAPAATTSQWQPGSSIPVDFNALSQEFQQVAQAAQARQSPLQPQHSQEQPLAWPADEAFVRRDSQTSLLTHSMSTVDLHTPLPQQSGTFKSPAPPMSIAARRQRPRPTNLSLGSMRSQSYSGAVPQGSPVHPQQQQSLTPGLPLRRIRSSNVVNGVAQGRVMKSMPGSAQRSPLSWSFAEAMNSPQVARHMSAQAQSQGSLAPPTPMSPNEFPRQEQTRQFPPWQTSSGHISRQPSINETDFEHGLPYHPSASVPAQNFSSPPHTPMYYQQQFVQQRVGNNVIMENTPPQSAPAAQQCFPSNVFPTASQNQQSQQLPLHTQSQQQAQTMAMSQPEKFMNVIIPNQQPQLPNVTFASPHPVSAPASGPPGMAVQFANGVPQVAADGSFQVTFPSQTQFMPQQQQSHSQPQIQTPPQVAYPLMTSAGVAPGLQALAQIQMQAPQPPPEFYVHEYQPPEDANRAVTPRKAVDTGPKNYTFSNAHPGDFEERKGRRNEPKSTASNSPASVSNA